MDSNMPNDLHVLVFDVKGHADIEPPPSPSSPPSGPPSVAEFQILANLKESAESISQKIEREVRRILPPMVTVQASVQFDEGSVLITGAVALLSWATPIVLDAAKEELGQLVKLIIQRVISRYLPTSVGPIEMSVTPQAITAGHPVGRRRHSPINLSAITALFVITGVILILQLMLLFDRFFLVHLRP
jgi:hypothetical protein